MNIKNTYFFWVLKQWNKDFYQTYQNRLFLKIKLILIVFFISVFLIACKTNSQQPNKELAIKLTDTVALQIDRMRSTRIL